jgi:iron(III) transport system substrate-binding protein
MVCAAAWLLAAPACQRRPGFVVVYTALDKEFSQPILKAFEGRTGLRVLSKYDVEATKTVGLVNAIRAEKDRPRCDVFWNNEIVNTIRLKQEGLLQAFRPKAAEAFPAEFRDPDGTWTGFAARARVLLVNTQLVRTGEEPDAFRSLADPKWKGRAGIARPLFGTTATHVAALFAVLGDAEAQRFLQALRANEVHVLSGNKACALQVAAGRLAFALTDTDDAIIEVERGQPVKIVYPDAGPDGIGVLFIPNTLALVRGAPNPDGGKRLIEYLLSPEVEEALARCPSAQIPLNPNVAAMPRVRTPSQVKAMKVSFEDAAKAFARAAERVEAELLKP